MAIIATKVGAIPQMIEDSGVLIEKESVEEIVSSIENMMNLEFRKALAEKAYENVLNNYLIDIVFENIKNHWK
jgi:glycosyltransferase involved in cell wall biosynthesis